MKYPEVKLVIVSLLEGGNIMTPSMMIQKDPRLDQLKVGNAVRTMLDSHEIIRVRRGLYMLPSYEYPSDTEIEKIINSVDQERSRKTHVDLLRFLCTPRELGDVQQFLSISRQGAGQKLKLLTTKGIIHRATTSGKEFLYCSDRSLLLDEIKLRKNKITKRELYLLERLPLQGFAKVGNLPRLLGRSNNSIDVDIIELLSKNLVVVEALGGSRYIRITDAGREESVNDTVVRLDPANVLDSFGRSRGNIIRIIAVLGAARSPEIRYCLARMVPLVNQVRVPQMIQHMQNQGLIETSDGHGEKAKMRRLTPEGARIGRILAEHIPNPTCNELRDWINEGETTDAMRLAGLIENRRLSERSLSILRLLEGTEEGLTRKEIGRRLPLPYAKETSVNQAVNSLELRGLVEREQGVKGYKGSPLIFFLTEAGRRMLNDMTRGFRLAGSGSGY